MDVLIKQITQIFEKNKIERNESAALALKEIVLSAFCRSGFLKLCPYLSKMDLYKENILYLLFLKQDESFSRKEHWQAVNCELDAAGVANKLIENENGFSVEYDSIKVVVFIYKKDFGLQSEFKYQLQPIPYELRSISSMSEGIRSEIEKTLESSINPIEAPVPEKGRRKNSSKPKEKVKKKKEQEEHWVQPSLFDF